MHILGLTHMIDFPERYFIKFNKDETTFGVANVNVGCHDLVVVGDKGNPHEFYGLTQNMPEKFLFQ